MQPDISKIAIHDNEAQILKMLDQLMLKPRLQLIEWSKITKQTPNVKIGYPGQHLASLITGIEGSRTGARGHDLSDGSEVKSCSRIDQLDKCSKCKGAVARLETLCSTCGSTEIERKKDSKWLFTIKTEAELETLTNSLDRVLLVLGDHPNFDSGDFTTLRFQAWEIWPKEARFANFVTLMENYHRKIYMGHKAINQNSSPAPKNFWPYSYQFYMCNPVKTMSCTVVNAGTNPVATIDYYVEPDVDRATLSSEIMPASILAKDEMESITALSDDRLIQLVKHGVNISSFRLMTVKKMKESLKPLDEHARSLLFLRDTDVPTPHAAAYSRRILT